MNDIALIVIIGLCLMGSFLIGLSITKAERHIAYLRMVNPSEYLKYRNYLTAFSFKHYNIRLQLAILPFFKREKELENDKSSAIAQQVNRFIQYQIGVVILITSFICYVIISLPT
jgi:hypothetical protein